MLSIFQNPLLLGLPVSLYAQSIPLAFPEGPNTFLNNQYGENDQLYNYLYGHGCFCSKIFDITADYNDASLRGGTQPVDEMDRICMKWLRTRDCDSNLLGGECYNVDLDTRSYDSSDCSSLSDGCDQNACLIDEFYFNQIVDQISFHTIEGVFQLSQVVIDQNSVQTCPKGPGNSETKYCTGKAPYLSVTYQAPFPDPDLSTTAKLINPRFKDGKFWNYPGDRLAPSFAIDGLKGSQTGRKTFAHSHTSKGSTGDTFYVNVDANANSVTIQELTHILIYPRVDCCQDRYTTYAVSVETVNGNLISLTPVVNVFDQNYVGSHIETGLRWNLLTQAKIDSGFMKEQISRIVVQNTDTVLQIGEIELYYGYA